MAVQNIYELTKKIKTLLENEDNDPRSEVIKQLNLLLNNRREWIEKLAENGDEAGKIKYGEEILRLNKEINELLNVMRLSIIKDMNQFRHQKQSVKRYRNRYGYIPKHNGAFIDKRD